MENLELQKAANEVRKGIITSVHAAAIPAAPFPLQRCLLICILKK